MTKKSDQLLRHWIINGGIILWFNISPSCSLIGKVLWTSWQNLVFVVLLLPLIGLAKSLAFSLNAYSSNCISEVSC